MQRKNVAPSRLPSFLLPCPHCRRRMEITAVTPALYPNGAASNDPEDIIHTCVQCGAILIRTRRPFTSIAWDMGWIDLIWLLVNACVFAAIGVGVFVLVTYALRWLLTMW
jgi:hypothetical protein